MRFVLGESELMSSKEWKEKSGKREKLSGKWQADIWQADSESEVGVTLSTASACRRGGPATPSPASPLSRAATSKSAAADSDSESDSESESAGYRTVLLSR